MTTRDNSLPIGTKLAQYKITDILGQGGFGITYLAEDTTLKHNVAIKEYFPTEMGIRDQDSITLHSVTNRSDDYQFGLNKFLEEGRTLVQFKHPNIVRVSNFLKLNNTAYLIMDYEQGEDLSDYLKRTNFKGNMPETEIKSYLVPILKGLHAVHNKGLLHRDVKPGNIYLRKDAEPMLIDFGAARYALGEHSKSMSAIISMGYAPPEQYSSKGKQNQASDLYAWGATAYQLITGKPPVESPDRSNAFFEGDPDPLTPISKTHADKYSKELLNTIDHSLQLPNKSRPQSAAQVVAMLKGEQLKSDKTKIVTPDDRFKSSHSDTGTKYVKEEERFTNIKPKKDSVIPAQAGTSSSNRVLSKKNNLLKYATIFLVLAALGTGSYFGYDYYQEQQQIAEQTHHAEQKAKDKVEREHQQTWALAEQTNSIASYQAYKDKYPDGKNNTTATNKITQLNAELGNLTAQAQKLLVKLEYQVPSNGKLDARTEAAVKDFEGKQNILVTGNIDNILITALKDAYNKKDQLAWNNAQGNIIKLQDYARNYSDGQFISQVEEKIQQIQVEAENQKKIQIASEKLIEEQRLAKIASDKAERQRLAKIQTEENRKQQIINDKKDAANAKIISENIKTPIGAQKGGNKEGTIPNWTGGITKPPAIYNKGNHHQDPFSTDKILFTIGSSNFNKYSKYLSVGQKAMFEKYPNSYKMNVYKSRRTASFPERIYEKTIQNDKTARLVNNNSAVANASEGFPFPNPKNAYELIFNHKLKYKSSGVVRFNNQVAPTASGQYTVVKLKEELSSNYYIVGNSIDDTNDILQYFYQSVESPARLAGRILLIHDSMNQASTPRKAWTYDSGQRRVRRAPNVAYDNPGTASDGLRTNDMTDMFNGSMDRFDWKIVGKKEMYVPYNSYKVHSGNLDYSDIVKPGHLNPDLMRYELHRMYVVEATLKSGARHINSKRIFYLDEDSYQIMLIDHYDTRGSIWRFSEAHCINYYDVPTFWSTVETHHDLRSGRYVAVGLDNKDPVNKFNVPLSEANYTPAALRKRVSR